jgi:hypothetical protein
MKPEAALAETTVEERVDDEVDADFDSGLDEGGASTADAPPADRPAVDEQPVDQRQLTGRERQILAFERKWWKHAGSKEQAIRDTFDLSATRYYQVLKGLLDNPAALAEDPILVGRLRRLRSTRARTRGAIRPPQIN